KVGEDRSRTRVESKGFADCQILVKQLTVCTDGDHPPFPSCPAVLSRSIAEAAGSIHLLYSAIPDPNLPLHCVRSDDRATLDGIESDVGIHGHPRCVTSYGIIRPNRKRIVYEQSLVDIGVKGPPRKASLHCWYLFHVLHYISSLCRAEVMFVECVRCWLVQ